MRSLPALSSSSPALLPLLLLLGLTSQAAAFQDFTPPLRQAPTHVDPPHNVSRHVRFKYIGSISPHVADGHVVANLPLKEALIRGYLTIYQAAEEHDSNHEIADDSITYMAVAAARRHMAQLVNAATSIGAAEMVFKAEADAKDIFYETFQKRPNDEHATRNRRAAIRMDEMDKALARARRSFGLIAGFAFAASSFLNSIFNNQDLNQLKAEAHKASGERKLLAAGVAAVSTQLGKLEANMAKYLKAQAESENRTLRRAAIAAAVADLGHVSNHMEAVANSAILGRADSSIISPTALAEALGNITEMARPHRFTPMTINQAEIAKMPASFLVSDTDLSIFLHVPLTTMGPPMTFWKLNLLPIHSPSGWLSLELPRPYLATSPAATGHFFTYSEADFKQCQQLRSGWSCPRLHDTLTPAPDVHGYHPDRCLHAIFARHESRIKDHCALTPYHQEEALIQTGPSTFVLFTEKKDRLSIQCQDKVLAREFEISGLHEFTLSTGCTASTRGRKIWPTINIATNTTAQDRAMELPDVIRVVASLNSTAAHVADMARESILEQQQSAERLAKAFAEDNPDSPFSGPVFTATPSHASTAIMIVGCLCALACAYVFWGHCKKGYFKFQGRRAARRNKDLVDATQMALDNAEALRQAAENTKALNPSLAQTGHGHESSTHHKQMEVASSTGARSKHAHTYVSVPLVATKTDGTARASVAPSSCMLPSIPEFHRQGINTQSVRFSHLNPMDDPPSPSLAASAPSDAGTGHTGA